MPAISRTVVLSRSNHALNKKFTLLVTGLCILGAWGLALESNARAAVNRGRQVILNRGLLQEAWVFSTDVTTPAFANVGQFLDATFTTVNFHYSANPQFKADFQTQAGTRPWSWSRISSDQYPDLTAGELPYLEHFSGFQYGDELPQTQSTLDAEKAAYTRWHTAYPNALAYTNFYGGQMDASSLENYIQYTRPDLLLFDNYPSYSFPDSARNRWYSTMQLYRTTALKGFDGTGSEPLPYGQYLNLYRSTVDGALPSESFVRLQKFASWAFGYTFTSAFVYNRPGGVEVNSVMFDGDGDLSPTPVFNYVAESNRQSRHLGPALTRLVSTDIRMIPGTGSTVTGTGLSAWNPLANNHDNYILEITPTVSAGGANDSSYSDTLVGYFKPLLADNSDYPYADGTHFMIVNAASQGTAAASEQWYHLTFDFGNSGYNALQRLSRETGAVEEIKLTNLSGSLYATDLKLPGGTGDLFRYTVSAQQNTRVANLYVSSATGVAAYDASGNPVGSFSPIINGQHGLQTPQGIAVGPDGFLYVVGQDSGNILKYNATTGAFVGQLISLGPNRDPDGIAFGPDKNGDSIPDLYVVEYSKNDILVVPTTGPGAGIATNFVTTQLIHPTSLEFRPDGKLYVASRDSNKIQRFNVNGTFDHTFATVQTPGGFTFSPDGSKFYSGDTFNSGTTIQQFNGTTGALLNANFTSGLVGGPKGMAFGPDGNLYAAIPSGGVAQIDGTTGARLNDFFVGAIASPRYLLWYASITLGDYNGSGTVDTADYVVWRNSVGQIGSGLAADGNNDGVVNSLDYNVWRNHFGQSSGGSAVLGEDTELSTAVPEPASITTLLAGCIAWAFKLRNNARIISAFQNDHGDTEVTE